MLWIIALTIVLIALYGLVSLAQKRGEFRRRLDMARSERDRIASELTRLQAESRFLEVYRSGESAELAHEILDRMNTLNDVFSDTVREFERVNRASTSLDAQVRVSRVVESFQKISDEIPRLQRKLNELNDILQQTKSRVEPIRKRFSEVKERLVRILESDCPASWQGIWRTLEQRILALSLQAKDPEGSELKQLAEEVDMWDRRRAALAAWREWKTEYAQRSATLTACVERLRRGSAGDTHACKMLERILQDAGKIVKLSPETLVEPRMMKTCLELQQQLPSALALAMRLVSILTDRDTLTSSLASCKEEAETLLQRLESSTFVSRENMVQKLNPEGFETLRQQKNDLVKRIQNSVRSTELRPDSPLEAIEELDLLIYATDELHKYESRVEEYAALLQKDETELQTRVHLLTKRIAQALARLVEVNLADSDQYRKMSVWQSEIHEREERKEISEDWIAMLERRFSEEMPVVEAAIRNQKSLDASLQSHLDRLEKSGRYSDRDEGFNPGDLRNRISTGDIMGAALTSLVLTEMLDDAVWDDDWNSW